MSAGSSDDDLAKYRAVMERDIKRLARQSRTPRPLLGLPAAWWPRLRCRVLGHTFDAGYSETSADGTTVRWCGRCHEQEPEIAPSSGE